MFAGVPRTITLALIEHRAEKISSALECISLTVFIPQECLPRHDGGRLAGGDL